MILEAIAEKGRVGRVIVVIFIVVIRLRNGGIGRYGCVFHRLAVAVVPAMFLVNVANGLGLCQFAWCAPPRNDSLRDHFISTILIVIVEVCSVV